MYQVFAEWPEVALRDARLHAFPFSTCLVGFVIRPDSTLHYLAVSSPSSLLPFWDGGFALSLDMRPNTCPITHCFQLRNEKMPCIDRLAALTQGVASILSHPLWDVVILKMMPKSGVIQRKRVRWRAQPDIYL